VVAGAAERGKFAPDGKRSNELTSETLTDIGAGATFIPAGGVEPIAKTVESIKLAEKKHPYVAETVSHGRYPTAARENL